MHRPILILFCLLVAASIGGIYWLYQSEAEQQLQTAQDQYERMRTNVDELNMEQTNLKSSLSSLQTHVESVEIRAREQYRLIKPGEHIAMIKVYSE